MANEAPKDFLNIGVDAALVEDDIVVTEPRLAVAGRIRQCLLLRFGARSTLAGCRRWQRWLHVDGHDRGARIGRASLRVRQGRRSGASSRKRKPGIAPVVARGSDVSVEAGDGRGTDHVGRRFGLDADSWRRFVEKRGGQPTHNKTTGSAGPDRAGPSVSLGGTLKGGSLVHGPHQKGSRG